MNKEEQKRILALLYKFFYSFVSVLALVLLSLLGVMFAVGNHNKTNLADAIMLIIGAAVLIVLCRGEFALLLKTLNDFCERRIEKVEVQIIDIFFYVSTADNDWRRKKPVNSTVKYTMICKKDKAIIKLLVFAELNEKEALDPEKTCYEELRSAIKDNRPSIMVEYLEKSFLVTRMKMIERMDNDKGEINKTNEIMKKYFQQYLCDS